MICAGNSSPASARSAVCTDWTDDGNWAARLPAQETKGEQEERGAQTLQQMKKEATLERRHHHQPRKCVPEASPARTCGALGAFDAA